MWHTKWTDQFLQGPNAPWPTPEIFGITAPCLLMLYGNYHRQLSGWYPRRHQNRFSTLVAWGLSQSRDHSVYGSWRHMTSVVPASSPVYRACPAPWGRRLRHRSYPVPRTSTPPRAFVDPRRQWIPRCPIPWTSSGHHWTVLSIISTPRDHSR